MQSNRRKLGLVIILLALVLILLIVWFFFLRKPAAINQPGGEQTVIPGQLPNQEGTSTPSDAPRNYQRYDLSSEGAHTTDSEDLGKLGMAFAERLGSFSNQSDYGNFSDLRIFMTQEMKDWAATYVDELKSKPQSQGYYGITTDAISYEVKSFDEGAGTADLIVQAQRRESTDKIGGGSPYYQNLELSFKKVDGEWLVSRAYWQK